VVTAAAADVVGLALAWTVTVVVGAAVPGAGVLPQAASRVQAPARTGTAASRAARVSEGIMGPGSFVRGRGLGPGSIPISS
jgi:hypothetical protein